MKKIFILTMCSLTSIILVACSGKQSKDNNDNKNINTTDTKGVITDSDKKDSVNLKITPNKDMEISKGLIVKIDKATKNKQEDNEYITIHYKIKNNTNKSVGIGAGDFEVVNQGKKQEMFGLLENFGGEVKPGESLEGDGSYTWKFSSDDGSIKYAPKIDKVEQNISWKIEK